MLQSVNEESLKKLQEYLCTVKGHRKVAPISLVFYIRDTTARTNSAGNRTLPFYEAPDSTSSTKRCVMITVLS